MTQPAVSQTFPPLETERLFLRSFTFADTDFVFQHFSNPAVAQYLLDEPPLTDIAQAQEIIEFFLEPEGKTYNRWGLFRKADQQCIGSCGFHKWDRRNARAEIGYDLSPDFWGQGLMAEALRAAIAHGFDHMQLNRIDALVYVENERSAKLLQRLGFTQEGVLRDYFCLDGKYYDHFLFSLLQREWKA
ncbi:MAG: GNAT family N-acetyltransferase [Anaerolineae bacterium]|nr:GNAT family N-acetyltransferase [Anaerolineae bacterium]